MGVRLPTILGKAIEDVYRTVNEQARRDGSRRRLTDAER